MFALRDGSRSTCLPKATALRQETRAVCDNQMISSHRFEEDLKQSCTQNSERLLRTPVAEKDGWKKMASSFWWTDVRRTGWFPFDGGVAKSGRVSRKEAEQRSLAFRGDSDPAPDLTSHHHHD